MLDADLAELYRVPTKRLNEAVKRNLNRFPEDFMFQISAEEGECLRSQIATSKDGRGGRRYQPYAFTEHGVAMLSSVLSSERAVQMNILIIRAFVRMRQVLATHRELARKIEQLQAAHKDHAAALAVLIHDVQNLERRITAPRRSKARIGFVPSR